MRRYPNRSLTVRGPIGDLPNSGNNSDGFSHEVIPPWRIQYARNNGYNTNVEDEEKKVRELPNGIMNDNLNLRSFKKDEKPIGSMWKKVNNPPPILKKESNSPSMWKTGSNPPPSFSYRNRKSKQLNLGLFGMTPRRLDEGKAASKAASKAAANAAAKAWRNSRIGGKLKKTHKTHKQSRKRCRGTSKKLYKKKYKNTKKYKRSSRK